MATEGGLPIPKLVSQNPKTVVGPTVKVKKVKRGGPAPLKVLTPEEHKELYTQKIEKKSKSEFDLYVEFDTLGVLLTCKLDTPERGYCYLKEDRINRGMFLDNDTYFFRQDVGSLERDQHDQWEFTPSWDFMNDIQAQDWNIPKTVEQLHPDLAKPYK